MLIRYVNSHTVVLRQWHTFCITKFFCIYNSSELSSTKIYFRMLKSKDRQIVTIISFLPNTVKTTPDFDYKVFSIREVTLQVDLNT